MQKALCVVVPDAVFSGGRVYYMLPKQSAGFFEGYVKDFLLIRNSDGLVTSIVMNLRTFGYVPVWDVPVEIVLDKDGTLVFSVGYKVELFPQESGMLEFVLYPMRWADNNFAVKLDD